MQTNSYINKEVYYRLIALWVLCEAMLGGIIHGFKIPVSGLIVGSCAVICICLIAWYVPAKGSVMKATIIVAIFKMMLSPQAPPPAYIAVFFQGVLGELLFWKRSFFRVSCIVLAVLCLLESGLQRIIMLTIIYSNDIWKVFNDFMNGLTKQKTTTNYSLWIGAGYVALHFITGIFVGWWASGLPARITKWSKEIGHRIAMDENETITTAVVTRKKKRMKTGLFVTWILLIALYIQSYFKIGTPLLPSHIALKILLRSFIIVLGWLFIIGPLIQQVLHRWLKKKQSQSQQEVQQVLQLLPATQNLVVQSWKRTANKKGCSRLKLASKMILVNSLNPAAIKQVYILTAPVQTGKTTSIVKWSEKRKDVYGILTPVVMERRMFMDAGQRELFPMEAKRNETRTVSVGRFTFSKTNFDKASQIIRDGMEKKGWLVIDEIGPLELRGEGFSDVLKEVLAIRKDKILLVIRDSDNMVTKVKDYFDLKDEIVITTISAL